MNNKLLTVKEYAAAQGITAAAVYKQISTKKLNVVEKVENGRKVKYIKAFDDSDSTTIQPNSTKVDSTYSTDKINELAAVIEQKDKQIEMLQKRVDELTNSVIEQNKQLTELVKESHILLQNSQILLKGAADPPQIEETTQPNKKRHWWNRKRTE